MSRGRVGWANRRVPIAGFGWGWWAWPWADRATVMAGGGEPRVFQKPWVLGGDGQGHRPLPILRGLIVGRWSVESV